MQGKRLDRLGHLIQMELGQLLLHKVKDPRIKFATITHVNVAPDIRSARVFYSVMGDDAAKKSCQMALEKAAGFLQKEIAAAIEIRYTPKFTFSLDDSLDRGLEIDRILKSLDESKMDSKSKG